MIPLIARHAPLINASQPACEPPVKWPKPRPGRVHLVIVNGPPGVGKSTLVRALSRVCPRRNAHIDSDHLAYTRPGGTDRERLKLIDSNLAACLEGFRDWGAEYLFCTWITESQRRLYGLSDRARAINMVPRVVTLQAPVHVLVERMMGRTESRFEADNEGLAYLRALCARIERLSSTAHIDTAGRNGSDVLKGVGALVSSPEYWKK